MNIKDFQKIELKQDDVDTAVHKSKALAMQFICDKYHECIDNEQISDEDIKHLHYAIEILATK